MRMQELNNARIWWTTLSVDTDSCKHQPVYFGVTNINVDEKTIGSVDVWRCAVCKKKFCEEKQLGIEELADLVGMPKIDSDAKWGVTVCKLQQGKYRWKLVRIKENGEIKHECLDENIVSLKTNDFTLTLNLWSIDCLSIVIQLKHSLIKFFVIL